MHREPISADLFLSWCCNPFKQQNSAKFSRILWWLTSQSSNRYNSSEITLFHCEQITVFFLNYWDKLWPNSGSQYQLLEISVYYHLWMENTWSQFIIIDSIVLQSTQLIPLFFRNDLCAFFKIYKGLKASIINSFS